MVYTRLSLTVGVIYLALAIFGIRPVTSAEATELRNVDGGLNYYDQFSSPLSSDPGYFPIGVWFESVISQTDVDLDKDIGINLYLMLTANSDLSLVQGSGMRAILQESEWRHNQAALVSPAVAGWALLDEVDMQLTSNRAYKALDDILASLPNDRRLRYNNYGKGVMFWETNEPARRLVNDFQQVVSNDVYWFTDPHVSRSSEGGKLLSDGRAITSAMTRRAANYGRTVDRMRFLTEGQKPIWNLVEVGWPYTQTAAQGARAIRPAEIKAAVWHSIIAGARGIIYFNHSFGGPNQSQHCLRDPAYAEARTAVKHTNQLIARLAPVLNAQFADGFVSATRTVRATAKFHDGRYYVLAGSKENAASAVTFSLSNVESGTATVIGENRTIPILDGRFSDIFEDGNTIHIYRIDSQ